MFERDAGSKPMSDTLLPSFRKLERGQLLVDRQHVLWLHWLGLTPGYCELALNDPISLRLLTRSQQQFRSLMQHRSVA